jgi:hypothetical protein
MGLFSRQSTEGNDIVMVLPDGGKPTKNTIELAQQVINFAKPIKVLGLYELNPVLARNPEKKPLCWAFFYGYVAAIGMGLRLSVSEVENAAYFVFQNVFTMSVDEAIDAIVFVQDNSETEKILKCLMAGNAAFKKFINGGSHIPIDFEDIAVLL